MQGNSLCPLGLDVPAIVNSINKNDTKAAAEDILKNNPLPSICGRVCKAPCKGDSNVNSQVLMKFADVSGAADPINVNGSAKKVAIVGGGPAGLAAAQRLLQLGLKPTVFEAANNGGGMLADVIPSFSLPREMLAEDISNLTKMGVEIKTGSTVGKDVQWDSIKKEFDAILIATGAGMGIMPSIPGTNLKGSLSAIDFMKGIENGKSEITGNVVVQGGSLAALQTARAARKAGAARVSVVHPYPLDLWPAGSEEIEAAKKDGVELLPENRVTDLWGLHKNVDTVVSRPVEYALKDKRGRVSGIDMGKQIRISADLFIAAVDRKFSDIDGLEKCDKSPIGNLKIDNAYRISIKGWYAAGEAATGAAGIVDSMVTGQLAAEAIKKDLGV
ncbi:FAD-dependent oxidoreductase [Spirochaetota bacterium]